MRLASASFATGPHKDDAGDGDGDDDDTRVQRAAGAADDTRGDGLLEPHRCSGRNRYLAGLQLLTFGKFEVINLMPKK